MSFMRFGEDSDVHCFQNGDQVIVQVAGTRVQASEQGEEDNPLAVLNRPKEVLEGPYAGSERSFGNVCHARDFILELQALGYRVSDSGIEALYDAISDQIDMSNAMKWASYLDPFDAESQLMCLESPIKSSTYMVIPDLMTPVQTQDTSELNPIEILGLEYEPLLKPHAGEIFPCKDWDSMVKKVNELEAMGYKVSKSLREALEARPQ